MRLLVSVPSLVEIEGASGLNFHMGKEWAIQRSDDHLDFYGQGSSPEFTIHFPSKKELDRFLKQKGDIEFRR